MKSNKIIYQLIVADIQDVAHTELNRDLTDKEINRIIDSIAEKINCSVIIIVQYLKNLLVIRKKATE